MTLAAGARVLDDDKILSWRDEGGLPELSSEVNAHDLSCCEREQQCKENR